MIYFVYAQDSRGGIGYQNALPWHLPEDLKFFKETTMGQTIVMGRKTFESMGRRLLPGRQTLVLTREPGYGQDQEGLLVYSNPQVLLDENKGRDLYVIGGAEIFDLFWDQVDVVIRTYINEVFTCDTFVRSLELEDFELASSRLGKGPIQHQYERWVRRDRKRK